MTIYSMDDFNQNFQFQQQTPQMMLLLQESSVPSQSPLSMESMLQSLVEKQRREVDRYLQVQNNLLRANIQQHSKQHLMSLIHTLESKAALLIRKKDEELEMIKNRVMQLETCLKRSEQEKDSWENAARESEALAVSLSNALEKLQSPCLSSNVARTEEEDEMNSSRSRLGCCKVCGARDSRVLLLPCRHVCCCEQCDASVEYCPVCESAKEASVEVFLA